MATDQEILERVSELKYDVKDALTRIETTIDKLSNTIRTDYVGRIEYDVWTESAWREIQGIKTDLRETKKELDVEKSRGFDRYRNNIKWSISAIAIPTLLFIATMTLRLA